MVLSCYNPMPSNVHFINKEGVELFQICKDKARSCTYDTVFIKDNNSVAVSSGDGDKRCIAMIGIESNEIITPIFMDTKIYGMAVRGRTIYYCTRNKGLKMLNLSDKSLSDINSEMSGFNYVATFGDKLKLHKLYHTFRDMLRFTWYNTMGIQR